MDEALVLQDRVVPVPPPREPARHLARGRDDGGAHGRDDELAQASALRRLGIELVPARQHARVPVRLLVDDAARDDHAAALEGRAQELQLLRLQLELELEVLGEDKDGNDIVIYRFKPVTT